jgi:hypothetical protein
VDVDRPQQRCRKHTPRSGRIGDAGLRSAHAAIQYPRFRSRLFPAFLSLLGTAITCATQPAFQWRGWVSGNQRSAAERDRQVLGTNGQPVFLLKSDDLERRLRLNYPELQDAHKGQVAEYADS